MGDCFGAGKPSQYVTAVTVYPSGVAKSSTGLWLQLGWGVFTCVMNPYGK